MRTSAIQPSLFAVLIGVGLSAAGAAIDPGCLEFKASPISAGRMLRGTVVNRCGKAVTAYTLTVTVSYSDGKVSVRSGMGSDFLIGMGTPSSLTPPGIGAIQVGEERASSSIGIGSETNASATVTAVVARVNSVIFDDATAVGDDDPIENVFNRRRGDLIEIRFWQQSWTAGKSKVSNGPFARVVELTDAARRTSPNRQNLVAFYAAQLRSELGNVDAAVSAGKMTRAEAMRYVDTLLSTRVANFESNSTRRTQ